MTAKPRLRGYARSFLRLEILEDRQMLSTLTVMNTADSGTGSLRQAILDANGSTGSSTINFDIGAGTQTIDLLSALPAVSAPVTIDATPPGGFPSQEIELNGSGAGTGSNGLDMTGGSSTIKGDDHLAIDGFSGSGVVLETLGGDVVEGAFIGTNDASASGLGNSVGIAVNGTASNTIGAASGGNFISGNKGSGIVISGTGATGNVTTGNVIGTDTSGTKALGNGANGILIEEGAHGNSVAGGTNLISANGGDGIHITSSDFNLVDGDVIGTGVNGETALGNSLAGVAIDSGASNNTIGATSGGIINLISGNVGDGVVIGLNLGDAGTSGNLVDDNAIGTGVNGATTVGNGGDGVDIQGGASGNTVGGTTGAINLISANGGWGVQINSEGNGTGANLVDSNAIGTASSGTAALGNGMGGVEIDDADNCTLGGTVGGAINLISGNTGMAQVLLDSANGTLIVSNAIGTDVTGTKAFSSSSGDGIFIEYAAGVMVGTVGFNLISGNKGNGITIAQSDDTLIQDNAIGTDVSGLAALPNQNGVVIDNGTTGIQIGSPGRTNVISGNLADGVLIQGYDGYSSPNSVQGNVIGADVTGNAALGNGSAGVEIAASGITVGTVFSGGSFGTFGGNIIAFNGTYGILVDSGQDNAIHQNSIFGNISLGIDLPPGANNGVMAPALTSVTVGFTGTTITGTLSGTANTAFLIEFYLNPSSPAQGETQTFFVTETTNASGNVTFTATNAATFPSGEFVTATATDPSGDTSEFSGSIAS